MNQNLTEIIVLVDRSGSMNDCLTDAIGGLNAFVEEQKKVKGDAKFTYITFNTMYECVHAGIPLQDVPKLTLYPSGGTALYDAIARSINETGARFAAMKEEDRPGLVLFVILTDGQENSSVETTKEQVKEMITRQTNVYNWQFSYLGSNQDGFAVGNAIGVKSASSFASAAPSAAFNATNAKFVRMRCSYTDGNEVVNTYTEEEVKCMTDGKVK